MTYIKFHILRTQATMCTDLSDYIHQNITLVQGEFKENSTRLLKAIWELAYDFTPACLLRVCSYTQAFFAAAYNIPIRTVENWATGQRKTQDYALDLLAADALSQVFCV